MKIEHNKYHSGGTFSVSTPKGATDEEKQRQKYLLTQIIDASPVWDLNGCSVNNNRITAHYTEKLVVN